VVLLVMIDADSHKRTHTVVASDEVGREVGESTVRANGEGHLELVRWASRSEQVSFALEDCWHLTRRLESDCWRPGCGCCGVPTRLMAEARRGTRRPGKSDPIDAEAVALAALRYPDLPVAELDGPVRDVKSLSGHRRHVIVQRTGIASQIRWFLHELDPDLVVPGRGLRRHCVIDDLDCALEKKSP
jgi:transposase